MPKTTDTPKPAPFGPLERMTFDEAPMMPYWETTRGAGLGSSGEGGRSPLPLGAG